MINKPMDYDNTKEAGTYEPLPAGAYICKICSVAEIVTTAKKQDAIQILLDIAEGEHKGFYANEYRNDTRPDKKWGCIYTQLLKDKNGSNTNPFFKAFITSAEKSNSGFTVSWGEKFCECFKGKYIGVLFRREEYTKKTGGTGWSTKPIAFRSVDDVKAGIPVPADKPLSGTTEAYRGAMTPPPVQPVNYSPYVPQGGFTPVVNDDDLPF